MTALASGGRALAERWIAACSRSAGAPLVVVSVDMDRFFGINALHGLEIGHAALRGVHERLIDCFKPGMVFHAGSDEFVVVFNADQVAAERAVERAVAEVAAPMRIMDETVHLGASMGVAIEGAPGTAATELLIQADAALQAAKAGGRLTWRLGSSRAPNAPAAAASVLSALRQAVPRGELELHYQPKLQLRDGVCVGFEALLRWRSSGISPGALIKAAEESGDIRRLGHWILQEALAQARSWANEGFIFPVAVNLSLIQIEDHAFVDHLLSLARQDSDVPHLLQLEITESAVAREAQCVATAMTELREAGFAMHMDDFGTGYSALGALLRLPFDTIKIDRAFLKDLPDHQKSRELVGTLIRMAQQLGFGVVAEGVEHASQLDWLREAGCDQGQGFLFAPALPASQALDFALRNSPSHLAV